MNKQPENTQQVANRHHARINNSQRIRYVLGTRIIDGAERSPPGEHPIPEVNNMVSQANFFRDDVSEKLFDTPAQAIESERHSTARKEYLARVYHARWW
jgi:hypothetical protein